jgi:hypothetical protein
MWIKRTLAVTNSINVMLSNPGMCDTAMRMLDYLAKEPDSAVPAEVLYCFVDPKPA